MVDEESLDRFFGLFRGNRDFYVRHKAPFVERGGKTEPMDIGFAKDKRTGEYLPVTRELFKAHLNGGDGLAIAPMMNAKDAKNVCLHAAIDIDAYNVNFAWLVRRLYGHGFKFAAFPSKSGGLHVYFIFNDPEPGANVIQALKKIVDVFGLEKLYATDKNKSRVEIFPKQASLGPEGSAANCLLLPFYDAANGSKQGMLTAEGKLRPLAKAMDTVEGMTTSVKEIESALEGLPYSDAPFCVQSILLSGALTEGSGRDDFLFTAALYFKLKSPDDVEAELIKANALLEDPLDEKDVSRIAESATKQGYQIFGRCKKPPCSQYCDRALCKLREFGVGRGKNNMVSNVEFGKITRMLSEEPYYLWEARLAGTEEYVQVRIDGEADLLNQKVVQKACVRYLNQVPATVKQQAWEKILNDCLSAIEEIEVAEGTDTTETSALRSCFLRFLTHKRTRNGQPYLIQVGQAFYQGGVYYFTSDGVKQYLAAEKFNLRGHNLREQLLSYGCSEGELAYRSTRGSDRIIKCWKKPEDEELKEMDAFYEDIYEGDADIAERSGTGEGADAVGDGDDVQF
jgi:hypothetical protein